MMEISNAYGKVLELEGLLLILESGDAGKCKTDSVFERVYEKIAEIDADVTAARAAYVGKSGGDPCDSRRKEPADEHATGSAGAAALPDAAEEIADNTLLEEAEDADARKPVTDEPGVDVNRSALAYKAGGDIRKAFTLNDNYKFRRQLFGNSQESYADALSRIELMKSTGEAEDYFNHVLEWDADDPVVREFMTIVSAYFLSKQ